MASRASISLDLGGRIFVIRPLTIDQVERLEETVAATAVGQVGVTVGRKILAAALSRDHVDVDAGEIEATLGELAGAVTRILAHGGFIQDAVQGEERAAAPRASTGAPSEAA